MGAEMFTVWVDGEDAETAFSEAVRQARHEHGHGGYTGTIAEKDSYEALAISPMTREAAARFVHGKIDENDKWGPAYAIPYTEDGKKVAGWVFFGWASS